MVQTAPALLLTALSVSSFAGSTPTPSYSERRAAERRRAQEQALREAETGERGWLRRWIGGNTEPLKNQINALQRDLRDSKLEVRTVHQTLERERAQMQALRRELEVARNQRIEAEKALEMYRQGLGEGQTGEATQSATESVVAQNRREQLFTILDEVNEETFANVMKDKLRNCGYTTLAQVRPDILSCDEVISRMIENGWSEDYIKDLIREVTEEQSAAIE